MEKLTLQHASVVMWEHTALKLCQEEVSICEWYNCIWQEKETDYNVCERLRKNLGC